MFGQQVAALAFSTFPFGADECLVQIKSCKVPFWPLLSMSKYNEVARSTCFTAIGIIWKIGLVLIVNAVHS